MIDAMWPTCISNVLFVCVCAGHCNEEWQAFIGLIWIAFVNCVFVYLLRHTVKTFQALVIILILVLL